MVKKTVTATVAEFKREDIHIPIIGTAPLIIHAFAQKSRTQMIEKQMKVAKAGRDARSPIDEFEAARYRFDDDSDGFPAVGFKASAVTACTQLSDTTKVAARQGFLVRGMQVESTGSIPGSITRNALVQIIARPPNMREDVVRLSGPSRSAEMRYRPEYHPWGCILEVTYNKQMFSRDQLLTMFAAAGSGVGIGDYRPERNGDCGTFRVADGDEFAAWRKEHKL